MLKQAWHCSSGLTKAFFSYWYILIHFLAEHPNPYVQNSFSPVFSISPLHLGHVCKSHILMSPLPHFGQSLPTSLLKDGATSAMMPPTTIFCTLLHSGHTIGVIFWRKWPRPSYTSAVYPQLLQRYICFQAIFWCKDNNKMWHNREENKLFFVKICTFGIFYILLHSILCTTLCINNKIEIKNPQY